MRFLFLLFIPMILHSQTIHQEDEKIEYKDKIAITTTNSTDIYSCVKGAFLSTITDQGKLLSASTGIKERFTAVGEFPLTSTAAIVKSATFSLSVKINPGEYSYKIDSVHIIEHVRGGKTTTISSKDFLKRMEQTGDVAMFTERVLNEIDMRIQKFLATTNKKVQNSALLNYQ